MVGVPPAISEMRNMTPTASATMISGMTNSRTISLTDGGSTTSRAAGASSAPAPPAGASGATPVSTVWFMNVFLPLVPWVLIFGAIILTLRIVRGRQGPRAMLARAPAFRGEMVADVDAAGVSLLSRLYRAYYPWE